jgi:periplasmic protein TonB
MDVVHSSYSPIFDDRSAKKFKLSFWLGLSVAVGVHAAIAGYMISQRFAVEVPEVEDVPHTVILIDRPRPKEEPPKPVKTTRPPPIPLTSRPVETPVPDTVEKSPIPASDKPADSDGKTPPVLSTLPPAPPVADPGPGPVYVAARWTRFPDSETLVSYYPARAEADEVEGLATVECTVNDAKGRVSCVVMSESPKGYGFGKATVTMVQKEGRVDTSQGDVRVGSKLKTTVKWTLD